MENGHVSVIFTHKGDFPSYNFLNVIKKGWPLFSCTALNVPSSGVVVVSLELNTSLQQLIAPEIQDKDRKTRRLFILNLLRNTFF